MKRSVPILFLLLVVATVVAVSQDETDKRVESQTEIVTLEGYIVDAMCGDVLAKKQKDIMHKASRHTRKCGLAEACAAAGYGLFTEGKWVEFDAEGNTLANAALEKSTKDRELYFSVTGRMNDRVLAVVSISEISPERKAAPDRQD
ncbi:MAG: hypothetical protein KAJ12_03265 [Bacteroidetes bacterium]|nr:hypothetical protein [Bacteroidota bacterium]